MSDNKGVNAAGTAIAVFVWIKIVVGLAALLAMGSCVAILMSGGLSDG